jgi:SWI/SNF-related matrix-associated actin-dependent regulator 1 of chromatin subfamily A
VQAIAVAAYFRDDWPLLVVCPSSLRIQWAQQFEKWLPKESVGVNVIMKSKRAKLDAPINILSFSFAALMTKVARSCSLFLGLLESIFCRSLATVIFRW